jgi:hypothetical protein
MEPAVPSGPSQPLTEDTNILTVNDDENIKSIYDVPFVSVFWVGEEIHAEVFLAGVPREIGLDRLMTAHLEARKLGYRSYCRNFGDWGQVLCRFSDSPYKGTIWALENELDAWLQ